MGVLNKMNPFKSKQIIPLTLEQYICEDCEVKFYINKDDQNDKQLICPFCSSKTENIRKFEVGINLVEDHDLN